MMAAASGNADAVKVLLDHGADVNAKESAHGQTALMFAAALNRADVVQLLLARGADPNVATIERQAGAGPLRSGRQREDPGGEAAEAGSPT